MALFRLKRTECIDSLLDALGREESVSKELKVLVIQIVFFNGAKHDNAIWIERFYNHPAITPEAYARGLILSRKSKTQNPTFQWLLAKADFDDLQAIQRMIHYVDTERADFMAAINKALRDVKPGGTRLGTIDSEAIVDSMAQVRDAIDKAAFTTVNKLCMSSSQLQGEALSYATETKDSDIIINFIRRFNLVCRGLMLAVLYEKRSKAVIKKVLEEIDYSFETLLIAAQEPKVIRLHEKYLHLLNMNHHINLPGKDDYWDYQFIVHTKNALITSIHC